MKELIICDKNRDGAKIWLEQVENTNEYTIHSDKPYVLEYCRVIYDSVPENATIFDFNWDGKKAICKAFDPSGGPYIAVGGKINEGTISRIYVDYTSEAPTLKFVII